jgi:hypothetical protein
VRRKRFVHDGVVAVSAFVVDIGLIGEMEGRRRVLTAYRPGVRVHAIDSDRWIVVLPTPVELDSRSAPGGVLTASNEVLLGAPGLADVGGDVVFWRGGSVAHDEISRMTALDPSAWIDVDGLAAAQLEPVELPTVPLATEEPAAPAANIRKLTHIRERSSESQEIGESLADLANGKSGRRGSGSGGGRGWSLDSLLARLVLRSPLEGRVRGRQLRYLQRLAGQFGSDLDEALRNAIPLGGLGSGARTLRLPRPRANLSIGRHGGSRASVDVGTDVFRYLTQMYRRAAEQLEGAGRMDEAVFVFVELLTNPLEGVAVCERHGRFQLAATIAEDRHLDNALVSRLWWLAGDRTRSVMVARRHGVFGQVIDRLQAIDPLQARELRIAWVDALTKAGDLLGAIAAGWPDAHLRPSLASTIRRGITLGGPTGMALRAYLLELEDDESNVAEIRTVLDRLGAEDGASLRAFTIALDQMVAVPEVDREIASLTLRALARGPRLGPDAVLERAARAVRARADPVLVADLPAGGVQPPAISLIEAPALAPGLMPILDAAPLQNGNTLVALGEAGCRLLTPDGRTSARWDVSTHRLVVADHGGSALLVTARGTIYEVNRLDLASRSVTRYGSIEIRGMVDTFDGAIWPVLDERGIAFLDTLAPAPHVVWRELEPGWACDAMARDERHLAALVRSPTGHGATKPYELWRWRMPGTTLATRFAFVREQPSGLLALLSDGAAVWGFPDRPPEAIDETGARAVAYAADAIVVVASQAVLAVGRVVAAGQMELSIHADVGDPNPALRASLSAEGCNFRAIGARVACWDGTGRLVTALLEPRRLVTATRLLS